MVKIGLFLDCGVMVPKGSILDKPLIFVTVQINQRPNRCNHPSNHVKTKLIPKPYHTNKRGGSLGKKKWKHVKKFLQNGAVGFNCTPPSQ